MPDRTSRAAMENLVKANSIRVARAEDKRRIARRELDAIDVLRSVPEHWRGAELRELLTAIPNVGPTKVKRWCLMNRPLSPDRRLGRMTERERELMARTLESWAAESRRRSTLVAA